MKSWFSKIKYWIIGFLAGILNGFFGSGGGLLVVPMLSASDLEQRKAHATSIAIILPLSLISIVIYLIKGIHTDLLQLGIFTAAGAAGAVIGSFLLMKIKNQWMKRIFGIVMIVSAIRLLLK